MTIRPLHLLARKSAHTARQAGYVLYRLYAISLFGIAIPVLFVVIAICKLFISNEKFFAVNFTILRGWTSLWSTACGIRYRKYYSSEYVPLARAVYVSNHCSYFDVPAQLIAMTQPYKLVGLSYFVQLPVFGYLFKEMTVGFDRTRLSDRVRCLQEVLQFLRTASVFIFPEGTTVNTTGGMLGPFQHGAFTMAISSGCPIQPIIFLNNTSIMIGGSLSSIRPGICRILYLPVMSVEGYKMKDVTLLRDRVRSMMESALAQYRDFSDSELASRFLTNTATHQSVASCASAKCAGGRDSR